MHILAVRRAPTVCSLDTAVSEMGGVAVLSGLPLGTGSRETLAKDRKDTQWFRGMEDALRKTGCRFPTQTPRNPTSGCKIYHLSITKSHSFTQCSLHPYCVPTRATAILKKGTQ